MDDEAGYVVMKRVAADENLHHLFYRDLVSAALQVDPSGTVEALERQVVGFAMPGLGIPGFRRHAAAIARQRIYDLEIHYESVVRPMFGRHWTLTEVGPLTHEAELARERLLAYLDKAAQLAARTADRAAQMAARGADHGAPRTLAAL